MSQKGVPAVPPIPATPHTHILTGAKKVVFAYDVVCPYAYIASRLLDDIAHECHAQVDFHPVLLSGLVTLDRASRDGLDQPQPQTSAAKETYKRTSLTREAARHGVELHIPAYHPVRSVAAMRVLAALEGAERVALTHALFRAYWVEGKDISNESVIMGCITGCGIKAVRINSQSTLPASRPDLSLPCVCIHLIHRSALRVLRWHRRGARQGGADRLHPAGVRPGSVRCPHLLHPQPRARPRRHHGHLHALTPPPSLSPPAVNSPIPCRLDPLLLLPSHLLQFFGVDRLMFVRAALGDETDQHLLFRVTTDPAPLGPLPAVEFFFDVTSPWSFLAFTQLRKFSHLCSLTLTPIVVGGLFKALHVGAPSDSMGKNKLRYYGTDLQDFAAWWQEPLDVPPFFPIKPITPNRLVAAHPACAEALFRALWQHGRNVGEAAEAVAVLDEAGYRGTELLAKAESSEVKAKLLANTKRAETLGLFGVPSYLVQGQTLIWGQDHIDTLLDVLSGWTPPEFSPSPPTPNPSPSTPNPSSLPAKL